MLGSYYVIEHCVTAISAKNKFEAFQIYTSDMLKGLLMSLGAKQVKRFYDVLHPTPQDDRSPEEIIQDITVKAGLKVVKKNGCNDLDGNIGS